MVPLARPFSVVARLTRVLTLAVEVGALHTLSGGGEAHGGVAARTGLAGKVVLCSDRPGFFDGSGE